MKTRLVNLTQHPVTILSSTCVGDFDCSKCKLGQKDWCKHESIGITIPPSGIVIRCGIERRRVKQLAIEGGGKIYLTKTEIVSLNEEDLPPEVAGTLYIVSSMVAEMKRERRDLVFPDLLVRKGEHIVGCKTLSQVPLRKEAKEVVWKVLDDVARTHGVSLPWPIDTRGQVIAKNLGL